jgi:hypothetical protein
MRLGIYLKAHAAWIDDVTPTGKFPIDEFENVKLLRATAGGT